MGRYALLILPSANRVYAAAAVDLTVAELGAFNEALGGRLSEIEPAEIAGVPYVTFEADPPLELLGNLSSGYALFERRGEALYPVRLNRLDQFDDDLLTIQKYPGKTNEQFTKLLLNVTMLAAGEIGERQLRVLDPLCGRGTTLNQALMYGFDAAGLDLDLRDVEAYATFVKTYLKRKRIKHQADYGPVRRDKRVIAHRLTATLAPTRERYRAGDTLHLDVVGADTTRALEFFRPATMDLVVTDLPYGVQHGSRTTKLARSPLDLLTLGAPIWAELLRPGGALGLAWNTHVATREEAAAALVEAGLTIVPYEGFRHRVDQSIVRDILVARK